MLRICSPAQWYLWSAEPAVPSGSHCQLDVALQGIKLTYNALFGQVPSQIWEGFCYRLLCKCAAMLRRTVVTSIERTAYPRFRHERAGTGWR
jgi:hypothetical protein